MRVLIATQYYLPEITAASARLHSFATGLAARGHEVEVVCEVPSHPEGVVAEGYGGRLVDRRRVDGVDVSHVWVHATPSKATRSRLLNYASYALSAALAGSSRRRPDVILASSPPLPVGAVGAALALRHRVPWVLDVRDLWPDVAVVVGEVSEGPMVGAARRLERRLYRSAAAITVTTEPFRAAIEARGGAGKVTVVANGASPAFLAAGDREPPSGALGGGPGFTWAYGGNLGLAQGLDSAVDAAAKLGDGFPLVLLGEGPRRGELERRAAALAPANVEFRPPVPAEEAASLLRGADALLVSLAAMPGLEDFVPSKLFDACALGRPVIVAAAGEAARLASESGAALVVPPGDADALAGAVRRLRDDPELGRGLAAAGRAFGEASSRERGAARLAELLESVSERSPRRAGGSPPAR